LPKEATPHEKMLFPRIGPHERFVGTDTHPPDELEEKASDCGSGRIRNLREGGVSRGKRPVAPKAESYGYHLPRKVPPEGGR